MSALENTRVRSVRIPLKQDLVVDGKTIGTTTHFPLQLANVSKTGMLLSWLSPHQAPFQENTILELQIDEESKYFDQPLQALGKIVRLLQHDRDFTQYGVRIVQIDPKDQLIWEQKVHLLEENTPEQEKLSIPFEPVKAEGS